MVKVKAYIQAMNDVLERKKARKDFQKGFNLICNPSIISKVQICGNFGTSRKLQETV